MRKAERAAGTGSWRGRLSARLAFPPNQMALGLAVRAVFAVALPLLVLRLAGLPLAGLYLALGALQIALADTGGPYRDRLLSITSLCLVLPEVYFLGTQLGAPWWAAAIVMSLLAFAGAILRSLGTAGLPMGMLIGASYLIGTMTPAAPLPALDQMGWFFAGGVWTVVLTLAAWRLRPYLALQRLAGAALDAAARFLAAVPEERGAPLAARELAVRAAIEQARTAIGTTRTMAPATDSALAQLYALLYVPSRLAVIALDLAELRPGFARDPVALATFDAAVRALAHAAAGAARAVLAHREWTPAGGPAAAIESLATLRLSDPALAHDRDVAIEALRAAVTRLEEAGASAEFLARGGGGRWLPALGVAAGLRGLARCVGAQLSWRSSIFRHALRLAVVAGVAMAIEIYSRLPHGIWLTLTVLVVMQPDFGATRLRAVARAGGTLAGVIVAGVVLVMVPWPAAREAAVAALVFLTVFTVRFRYGVFVACLTPLVILLLALYQPAQGWHFVFERAGETVGGTLLALLGSLLLWPAWASRRVSGEFARALEAMGAYLEALFTAAADGAGVSAAVFDARRGAEVALANAEAAWQTMLAEPRRLAAARTLYFQTNAQLGRLMRHLGALSARLELGLERIPGLAPLADAWAAELGEAARALADPERAPSGRRHAPPPDLRSAPEGIAHLVDIVGGAVEALAESARPDGAAGRPLGPA